MSSSAMMWISIRLCLSMYSPSTALSFFLANQKGISIASVEAGHLSSFSRSWISPIVFRLMPSPSFQGGHGTFLCSAVPFSHSTLSTLSEAKILTSKCSP